MTHFAVSLILPEGVDDVEQTVERMLAPYDENGTAFAKGSRWDWWEVGGRWDGTMTGDGVESKRACPVCSQPEGDLLTEPSPECFWCGGKGEVLHWQPNEVVDTLSRNSCRATDVVPDFVPVAYIDPAGEWHEQARMGWWGVTIPDEDGKEGKEVGEWKDEWREALRKHPSNIVVLVDCHV